MFLALFIKILRNRILVIAKGDTSGTSVPRTLTNTYSDPCTQIHNTVKWSETFLPSVEIQTFFWSLPWTLNIPLCSSEHRTTEHIVLKRGMFGFYTSLQPACRGNANFSLMCSRNFKKWLNASSDRRVGIDIT